MINIITKEVPITEELKIKLEYICQFGKVTKAIKKIEINTIFKIFLIF